MGKRDDEIDEAKDNVVAAVHAVFKNKATRKLSKREGWSVTRMSLEVKVNCTKTKLLEACIAELTETYDCVGQSKFQAMFAKRR